jgi:hypothetical protein
MHCPLSAQILVAISCSLYGLVHVVYGPGQEATTLTLEYGAKFDNQTGFELLEAEKRKSLCFANSESLANNNSLSNQIKCMCS